MLRQLWLWQRCCRVSWNASLCRRLIGPRRFGSTLCLLLLQRFKESLFLVSWTVQIEALRSFVAVSQSCFWRFESRGRLRYIVEWAAPEVSKEPSTFFVKGRTSWHPKMKILPSLEPLETIDPVSYPGRPEFWTESFITIFTKASNWWVSWVTWVHSTPCPKTMEDAQNSYCGMTQPFSHAITKPLALKLLRIYPSLRLISTAVVSESYISTSLAELDYFQIRMALS